MARRLCSFSGAGQAELQLQVFLRLKGTSTFGIRRITLILFLRMSSCLEIQKPWVTSRVDAARTSSQRRDLSGHLKHSTPRDPKTRASIKYPQSPCADPSSMLRLWPSRTPRAHHSGHWGPQRMQESCTVPGRWAALWLRCGSLGGLALRWWQGRGAQSGGEQVQRERRSVEGGSELG